MVARSSAGEPSTRMTRSKTREHKRVVSARQHNADLTRSRLSNMPPEIIEHIADSVRDPIVPDWTATACFLNDSCTDFSYARFSLSALSQTCWSLRAPTERQLYRELHLGLAGWTEPLNLFVGGSLRHILHTLECRPELGTFVRSVAMDWREEELEDIEYYYESSLETLGVSEVEGALLRFLTLCPQLRKLLVPEFLHRRLIRSFPSCSITSFGTSFEDKASLRDVVAKFPRLTDLFLNDFYCTIPLDSITHHLSRLRIEGPEQNQEMLLRQALRLCGGTVTHLHIESIGQNWVDEGEEDIKACIAMQMPETAYHITNLHLKNIDVLSDRYNSASLLVQLLPLQYLHTERTLAPSPKGWNALPKTLRWLTMAGYGYFDEDKATNFIKTLVECLSSPTVSISSVERMELWGGDQENITDVGDVSLLANFCREKGIPWSITDHDVEMDPQIRVYFR